MLVDQTGFVTVGVIGLQGSGKSTVASLLAGNTLSDIHRYTDIFVQSSVTCFSFNVTCRNVRILDAITHRHW